MKLPPIKIQRTRRPKPLLPSPIKPRVDNGDEPELLTGKVKGMKASMAEERLARALDKSRNVTGWEFRYTIGAPRGMPGWKELDALVATHGQTYAIEVDSPFTHREKKEADRLHDAIALKELAKMGYSVFPQVIHINGELELHNQRAADNYVKRQFG